MLRSTWTLGSQELATFCVEIGSRYFLPKLALNHCASLNLHLLNWDYRHQPLCPVCSVFIRIEKQRSYDPGQNYALKKNWWVGV
jgi:hypothetical protein